MFHAETRRRIQCPTTCALSSDAENPQQTQGRLQNFIYAGLVMLNAVEHCGKEARRERVTIRCNGRSQIIAL